jgi:hypothetical protein
MATNTARIYFTVPMPAVTAQGRAALRALAAAWNTQKTDEKSLIESKTPLMSWKSAYFTVVVL